MEDKHGTWVTCRSMPCDGRTRGHLPKGGEVAGRPNSWSRPDGREGGPDSERSKQHYRIQKHCKGYRSGHSRNHGGSRSSTKSGLGYGWFLQAMHWSC